MKYCGIVLLLLAIVGKADGQARIRGVISGIPDVQALPMVQLFKKTNGDTVLTLSSFAEKDGSYIFAGVAAGTYVVYVTSASFKQYYPGFVIVRPGSFQLSLDTIRFRVSEVTELKGVELTAAKSQLFEQQNEKLVFNVESSVINVGSNGLETLQKIPGVFVDPNGNISINGQSGAQIRLNGRLLNMSASDKAELLRNIDISLIRKIEVSALPDATNDAAGAAGVINIILKRNIKVGLNGNVSFTHRQSGRFTRDNAGLSLNYMDRRWNFYTNLSFSTRTSFDSLAIRRSIKSVDTLIGQRTYNRYPYRTLGINTGVIYKLTDKADLSVTLNATATKGKTKGVSEAAINKETAPALPPRSTSAANDYRNRFDYSGVNLNYIYRQDSLGTEFSINADYAVFDQRNRQVSNIEETGNSGAVVYQRLGDIRNRIEIKSADLQYFYHYDRSLILKGGLKYASSATANQADYWLVKNNATSAEDDKLSSFKYSEKILAGFLEVEKAYRKKSFVAGVRVENTNFDGATLLPKPAMVGYNRTDFFPFLFASQKTFGSQNVSLTYSRRLDRPGFQDMNPFIVYYDPYTYTKGNPKLKPQFTNKFEVAYNLTRMPVLKISYGLTRNALTSITYQNDTTLTTFKTVDNLARKEVWNFTTMVPIRVKNKLMSIHYLGYGITVYNGYYEKDPVRIKRNSFTYFNNTTYHFKNGLTIEAGGYYNRGMLYGLFDIQPIWTVNIGAQKAFFNNKLSVKLNATDIFRTQVSTFTFRQSNVDLEASQYQDTRSVAFSLVYKFGVRSKNLRTQSSSIEAEKNRVKQAEH